MRSGKPNFGAPTYTIMSEQDPAGVWVSHSWDMGATDVRPHASEIDALRYVNDRGYGSVIFLPFGETVDEVWRGSRIARRHDAPCGNIQCAECHDLSKAPPNPGLPSSGPR